jgi:AcrR family transcriptional regulator
LTQAAPISRDRILDAAEELFADRGFHGVSIRDITEVAAARLASVNYHFKSKENLYSEILKRRAQWIIQERERLLTEALAIKGSPEEIVRGIVKSFVHPLLEKSLNGGRGWKNYCRLLADTTGSGLHARELIATLFNPLALKFIHAIELVFPKADKYAVHYCYQLMLGSTVYIFSENGRIESITKGKYKSSDLMRISDKLIEFIVGGITQLTSAGRSRPVKTK